MGCWWITFEGRSSGSLLAATEEDARELASKHGKVVKVFTLPYPAKPRLDPERDGWDHKAGQVPSFCWRPEECKGKRSCPRNPSCTS